MNETDVGYVISTTPYREYDAMVHFLGEKFGLIRYVLRGYYKPSSKQQGLGLEFSKVRIRFKYQDNRLIQVQTGELLEAYLENRNSYDWLVHMQLVSEIIIKLYDDSMGLRWISLFEESLRIHDTFEFTKFMVMLIKKLGIVPNVDACVITGSTQVSDFSISKGGFVSKEFRETQSIITLDDLKYLRYIFVSNLYEFDALNEYDKDMKILNILINYIEFHMSIKINSWKLIYVV